MDITVVGLGEVGSASFKEFSRLGVGNRVLGYDKNPAVLEQYKDKYNVISQLRQSDVYIIAVYTTEQVLGVLNELSLERKPLVSIESTLDLTEAGQLEKWANETQTDLVTCPHRFNPNDPAHYVFNLNRVIGGVTPRALSRGMEFYSQFMTKEQLQPASSFRMAALSKVLENAHRANEIILAQEYKSACESVGIDFGELRTLTNTKWNIDIKEARDGVKGKCLPKDHALLRKFFNNPTLDYLNNRNDQYMRRNQ